MFHRDLYVVCTALSRGIAACFLQLPNRLHTCSPGPYNWVDFLHDRPCVGMLHLRLQRCWFNIMGTVQAALALPLPLRKDWTQNCIGGDLSVGILRATLLAETYATLRRESYRLFGLSKLSAILMLFMADWCALAQMEHLLVCSHCPRHICNFIQKTLG